MLRVVSVLVPLGFLSSPLVAEDLPQEPTEITPAVIAADGSRTHTVTSPYQRGRTQIRVLPPERIEPNATLRVVYVLPVEAGRETRYGDGLREVQQRGLADRHGILFVAPTFSDLPWYADHPTDPKLRQESYLLNVVIPFIERTYPVSRMADDRLLLGFSKSGWGAWTLLLRHPETFGRAVAWDAPLTMTEPGRYGSGPIFGTRENFARYRVTDLLRQRAELLRKADRLILIGYDNFRDDHRTIHTLLESLNIPHQYQAGPQRKHHWHSGWVSEAVELLVEGRK